LGGPRISTKRWLVRYPRGVPVAIFLLVAAITGLSVYAIERGESQRAEAQLHNEADSIASALERRANTSSAYLRAGSALLATLDEVTALRFNRFVSELRLDVDYGGAEGIGWAMIVPPGKVADFKALITAEAPTPVTLHPALAKAHP
jgi:CHASE1-domain containing sensor protein